MSYPILSAILDWKNVSSQSLDVGSQYGISRPDQMNLSSIIDPLNKCVNQYCQSTNPSPLGCVPGSSVTVPDYLTDSGEYGSYSNTIGSAQVRNPQHLARGTLLSHWDMVEYWANVPQ